MYTLNTIKLIIPYLYNIGHKFHPIVIATLDRAVRVLPHAAAALHTFFDISIKSFLQASNHFPI